jgi:hypothetical protein
MRLGAPPAARRSSDSSRPRVSIACATIHKDAIPSPDSAQAGVTTRRPRGSSSVMSARQSDRTGLEDFPTPPWATRALCERLFASAAANQHDTVWEPCAGRGHMALALGEYFTQVRASDVHDYGRGFEIADFHAPTSVKADWIITNPPFILADLYARTALARADRGVAALVRLTFVESVARYDGLFKNSAPTDILQFVERVPMQRGQLNRAGSTATAYCWLIWDKRRIAESGGHGTQFHWIPPCRKRLEKDSDYGPIEPESPSPNTVSLNKYVPVAEPIELGAPDQPRPSK